MLILNILNCQELVSWTLTVTLLSQVDNGRPQCLTMIQIFLASLIIFIELLDDRHGACLRNCPPSHGFPMLNERVLFPSRPRVFVELSRYHRSVSHVSHLCLAKYFHHRMCAGACLGVGIPPGKNKARLRHGKKWAEMRGSGAAIFWILETEIMRLRSVWECVSPHRSGQCRGWRQHHGSPSDITAHTLLTPELAPGAYYFVLSSSLPWLSHRPASSVERGVTGPREPVSKQYQENKSEDQL